MLWAHNDNAGLGRLHVADMNNGFLNGSKGSRGSGGGGGGFIPLSEILQKVVMVVMDMFVLTGNNLK